jgi:hypothetical protein
MLDLSPEATMQRSFSFSRRAILAAAAFLFFFPQLAKSQAQIPPAPRITAAMDESRLTTLHGNTHPLAKTQVDRGAAPPSLPLQRMLMVLKRGSQQESGTGTAPRAAAGCVLAELCLDVLVAWAKLLPKLLRREPPVQSLPGCNRMDFKSLVFRPAER